MKTLANVALLVILGILVSSCSDEDKLYPVCPAEGQQLSCVMSSDGKVHVQGVGQEIPDNFKQKGVCQFGISSCRETLDSNGNITQYDVICEGSFQLALRSVIV